MNIYQMICQQILATPLEVPYPCTTIFLFLPLNNNHIHHFFILFQNVKLLFFGKQPDFTSLLVELKQQTHYQELQLEATAALTKQERVSASRNFIFLSFVTHFKPSATFLMFYSSLSPHQSHNKMIRQQTHRQNSLGVETAHLMTWKAEKNLKVQRYFHLVLPSCKRTPLGKNRHTQKKKKNNAA
jgi:hypothetical protein